jgi:hypothetical protein
VDNINKDMFLVYTDNHRLKYPAEITLTGKVQSYRIKTVYKESFTE